MKNKKIKNNKNKMRCSLSGKIINSSEEVIKTKYAEEYLKKMGYKVLSPTVISCLYTLMTIFLIFGFLIITSPVVNSQELDDLLIKNIPTNNINRLSVSEDYIVYCQNNITILNHDYEIIGGIDESCYDIAIKDEDIAITKGAYNDGKVYNINGTFLTLLDRNLDGTFGIDYQNEKLYYGDGYGRLRYWSYPEYNYIDYISIPSASSTRLVNIGFSNNYTYAVGLSLSASNSKFRININKTNTEFITEFKENNIEYGEIIENEFYFYGGRGDDLIYIHNWTGTNIKNISVSDLRDIFINIDKNLIILDGENLRVYDYENNFIEKTTINFSEILTEIDYINEKYYIAGTNNLFILIPSISSLSPLNNSLFTTNEIIFEINFLLENINNVSLIINNETIKTNSSGIAGKYEFIETLEKGTYEWYFKTICDNTTIYATETRTLFVDDSIDTFETGLNQTQVETGNNLTLLYSINDSYGLQRCYYVYALTEYNITCGENKQTEFTVLENFNEISIYAIDNNNNTAIETLLFNQPRGIFYVDFSENSNIIIFLLVTALALFFFIVNLTHFTAIILLIQGFILMFNDINIIISLLVLLSGIIISFMIERREN